MTKHDNIFERNPKKTILISTLCILILIVMITEISLEKTAPFTFPIERHIRLKEHFPLKNESITPGKVYMAAADSLEQKSYKLEIDENGFINPSKTHSTPDLSMVFLGGSTTECLYVDEEKRFPHYSRLILEKKMDKKINSYNSGISGNTSLNSINILINKIIPLNPDIAILMHNINDMIILMYEKTYWNNNPYKTQIIKKDRKKHDPYSLLRKFIDTTIPNVYYKIIRPIKLMLRETMTPHPETIDEFKNIRNTTLSYKEAEILKLFEDNLLLFINICKVKNIQPILMTQANRYKENPDKFILNDYSLGRDFNISYIEFKALYDKFNEKIRSIAQHNKIVLIDLDKTIPKEKKYIYDTIHLNTAGSMKASEIIADKIFKGPINN